MEENVQINEETKGFIATGHFGTWHTVEAKEISGELFYRMEHEEYGDSVASIIVNQQGELVAEDLEHGFDQGAMEAIGEYFRKRNRDEAGTAIHCTILCHTECRGRQSGKGISVFFRYGYGSYCLS